MGKKRMEQSRSFLKDTIRKQIDFSRTDQSLGIDPPPVEKPCPEKARILDLPGIGQWKGVPGVDLTAAIANRQSRRAYLRHALTLDELSYLLWATQGIRRRIDAGHAYRTVPSAGCRHALETYLCVLNVEGLDPGVYRYLPVGHRLLFAFFEEGLAEKIVAAVFGQPYPGKAAATFIWTAIPYRMEWRYGLAAHKVLAVDAGTSARICTSPARRSAPEPARSPPTTRRRSTACCGSTERMSSRSTWRRSERSGQAGAGDEGAALNGNEAEIPSGIAVPFPSFQAVNPFPNGIRQGLKIVLVKLVEKMHLHLGFQQFPDDFDELLFRHGGIQPCGPRRMFLKMTIRRAFEAPVQLAAATAIRPHRRRRSCRTWTGDPAVRRATR